MGTKEERMNRMLLALAITLVVVVPAHGTECLFVADQTAGVIYKYSLSGTNLGPFVSGLEGPGWLAADARGHIYVTESNGARVDKFSPSGSLLLTITTPYTPGGVAVGSNGTIYVAHFDVGEVSHYSAAGSDLGIFAQFQPGTMTDFVRLGPGGDLFIGDGNSIHRFATTGADLGDLVSGIPHIEGFAFDISGNLYATETEGIEEYSATGQDQGAFISYNKNLELFGVSFDSGGNLYVADYGSGFIRKASPTGADLGIFASGGLINPRDVVVARCRRTHHRQS
jgi:hypothetical protein